MQAVMIAGVITTLLSAGIVFALMRLKRCSHDVRIVYSIAVQSEITHRHALVLAKGDARTYRKYDQHYDVLKEGVTIRDVALRLFWGRSVEHMFTGMARYHLDMNRDPDEWHKFTAVKFCRRMNRRMQLHFKDAAEGEREGDWIRMSRWYIAAQTHWNSGLLSVSRRKGSRKYTTLAAFLLSGVRQSRPGSSRKAGASKGR